MKRLPLFVVGWLLYIVLTIPFILLGVPLVAVLAALPTSTVRRVSQHYKDGRAVLCWRWRWINAIWGNDEDGVDGLPQISVVSRDVQPRQEWWLEKTAKWPAWLRVFVWSAIRNSTANMRWLPFFGMRIDRVRIQFDFGMKHSGKDVRYWLVWQGLRAGFRYFWTNERCFWIGWKLMPHDHHATEHDLPANESRAPGVGFAFQPYGSV